MASCGLLISNDLMFGSQALQAATACGIRLQSVATANDVRLRLDEQPWDLILVDLNMHGIDPAELERAIEQSSSANAKRIAIGPHVHRQKLDEARQAGWDVFTRGQFHANAAEIFRSGGPNQP